MVAEAQHEGAFRSPDAASPGGEPGPGSPLDSLLGPVPARAWSAVTVRGPDAAAAQPRSLATSALVAASAFLLTTLVVGLSVTWPAKLEAPLRAKMTHFLDHADEFDIVCFGSSNLHRSIDPALLDRRLGEQGVHVKTFNLAVPAMWAFETDQTLREVLARRPARMRYAVIELGDWPWRLPKDPAARSVSWHSTRQTGYAWRSCLLAEETFPAAVSRFLPHVRAWLLNTGNVGYGPEIVEGWLGISTAQDDVSTALQLRDIDEHRGYIGLDDDPREVVRHRGRAFRADPSDYIAQLAARDQSASAAEGATRAARVNVEALRAQIETLRAHGVEPIYVIGPVTDATPHLAHLADNGTVPALIAFNDPERYPELFQLKRRFDAGHVDNEGARILTEELARRLVPLLERSE